MDENEQVQTPTQLEFIQKQNTSADIPSNSKRKWNKLSIISVIPIVIWISVIYLMLFIF